MLSCCTRSNILDWVHKVQVETIAELADSRSDLITEEVNNQTNKNAMSGSPYQIERVPCD